MGGSGLSFWSRNFATRRVNNHFNDRGTGDVWVQRGSIVLAASARGPVQPAIYRTVSVHVAEGRHKFARTASPPLYLDEEKSRHMGRRRMNKGAYHGLPGRQGSQEVQLADSVAWLIYLSWPACRWPSMQARCNVCHLQGQFEEQVNIN